MLSSKASLLIQQAEKNKILLPGAIRPNFSSCTLEKKSLLAVLTHREKQCVETSFKCTQQGRFEAFPYRFIQTKTQADINALHPNYPLLSNQSIMAQQVPLHAPFHSE